MSFYLLFQTSLNLGLKRNSFYDSTDSESSSSEDEEETAEDEARLRKGKVVKAAFLWKKVSSYYQRLKGQIYSTFGKLKSNISILFDICVSSFIRNFLKFFYAV